MSCRRLTGDDDDKDEDEEENGEWQTRQSLASTHLAQQLERLLHAHHEEIKAIQLLQQHHTGG